MDRLARLHWEAIVAQHLSPSSLETQLKVDSFHSALDNELAALTAEQCPTIPVSTTSPGAST